MKATYQWKIMAASMLFGALTQSALANPGPINCTASNHQLLTFQLSSDPADYESAVYSGFATDLHGMNAALRGLPVKIAVYPILTRTVAGFNYSFYLPNGTSVALTEINYASPSFESQLGIKGHAKLQNGAIVGLQCQNFKAQQIQNAFLDSTPNETESCPPGEHWDATHHRIPTCVNN